MPQGVVCFMHLHLISTGKQTKEQLIDRVIEIHHLIDYIHLRERSWTAQDHLDAIEGMVGAGVSKHKIIINDRADVAAAGKLKGFHLASHSIDVSAAKDIFPNMHIGRSVHSVEEATKKEREGAYYVMYGHIFETKSKPGLAPRGLNNLKQVARSVSIPTVAIGGIEPTDVESVFQAGASGIAVLSGILLAEDVKKAAEQYREKINQLVR